MNDELGETMNINVIDETVLGIDTNDVKRIATDAMIVIDGIDDIDDIGRIAINIIMCDAVAHSIDGRRTYAIGLCHQMSPTRYVVHVVANDDWRFTLHHELYHVYEFINVKSANELACDEFASRMSDCQ